jgi:hypothetical protein
MVPKVSFRSYSIFFLVFGYTLCSVRLCYFFLKMGFPSAGFCFNSCFVRVKLAVYSSTSFVS